MTLASIEHLRTPGGSLRLARAWPRGRHVVHLEYLDPAGRPVAGQWIDDPDRLAEVVAATPAPASVLPGTEVLLQHGGADRRLPALQRLLAEPGSSLVSHRAERRAVVARGDGCFVKVVRPGRTEPLVRAAEHLRSVPGSAFAVPELVEHRPDLGVLVWSALTGPTLHTLPAGDPTRSYAAWAAAGRAVRSLHRGDGAGLPAHGAGDERAAALRWIAPAQDLGLLPALDATPALAELTGGTPGPVGLVHRDLHDKQLVVTGGPIGLLDADTLAVGELAVDVANLLVHVELRVAQATLAAPDAALAREAFLDGLEPEDTTLARVPAYARATRLRLAGVYAFRPRWRLVARAMLEAALTDRPVGPV